jgi:two-component system sensor histidine kinase AlgZ|tara:strand:+ start:9550 stop:10599 length:1050 start_codon:yes stop_codon:yes gene_type:complete
MSIQAKSSRPFQQDSLVEDVFFIPDLCKVQAVLFLLILTQLLSIVLCLVLSVGELFNWELLGYLSLYCHSIALNFAATMCISRKYLKKKSILFVSVYFLGTSLFISFCIGWLCSNAFSPDLFEHAGLFIGKTCIISSIIASILLRYFYLQAQWKEQKQSELKARIQALQARIRPHFLFNSMNSIASLIAINPQQAEDAVLDLCSLFRATLNNQKTLIPIEEEIELCKRYLNIEALRLGERLKLDWQIKKLIKKVQIPPLTLQPLFENAIYHGIQPRIEGGTITLTCEEKNNSLSIMISNPLPESSNKHDGNHIALDNIRSRIQAIFGDHAILKTSTYNNIFTVTLRIPI